MDLHAPSTVYVHWILKYLHHILLSSLSHHYSSLLIYRLLLGTISTACSCLHSLGGAFWASESETNHKHVLATGMLCGLFRFLKLRKPRLRNVNSCMRCSRKCSSPWTFCWYTLWRFWTKKCLKGGPSKRWPWKTLDVTRNCNTKRSHSTFIWE